MESSDLIKDLNALLQSKTEESAPQTKTLEEQIAEACSQAEKPAEETVAAPAANTSPGPKTAPAEEGPGSENDSFIDSALSRGTVDKIMKEMLLELTGPAKQEDGSDSPKQELYERAIRNGANDLVPAAYALLHAELALNSSSDTKEEDFQPLLLNSHPQKKALSAAAYRLEKMERLYNNDQYEEGFLEGEKALLSTDVKLYWYRLISLMEVLHSRFEKNVRTGIPGKLGEDVRRYTSLPHASAKAYCSGVFFSLLFTAALLYFLWCPPLRELLVTTIQPDHMVHVCVVIIVILFFIAGWAGAIVSLLVFAALGAGIEHFFGEAALGTTLIILIYLAGALILFLLARNTGYKKVKQHKKHKKIKKQKAELRRIIEPQLRQRLAKLDEIDQATKLDSDNTPAILYWTSITKFDTTEEFRKSFRSKLAKLRSLYQNALNSL